MNQFRNFLSIVLFVLSMNQINAQGVQALYPGAVPNYIGGTNLQKGEITAGMERISNVSIPTFEFFEAKGGQSQKPCVIICPGGGYRILASTHEGTDIAKKFNEIGIHALVLYYRLPDSTRQVDRKIAPLQDAQQAIRLVRKYANKWGVDNAKVGIMGFSAGGHLAASVATHFEKDYTGVNDGINLRPDFQILLYPVISFRRYGHSGSSINLIGKNPSEELIHLFSNEEQITDNTPKAFMVHAADDKSVSIKNSLYYVEKLTENNVLVDLHVYAKGGHGFGLNNKTTKELWFDRLTEWFKTNQIL
jgi:acetyl esterase/lipase